MRALAVVAMLATGCATFEDPTIVLDLRVIGMTARPRFADLAEHVIDVELGRPLKLDEVVAQLNQFGEQVVCATIADPGAARAIGWAMTACALDDTKRCDPARPQVALATGRIEDPEAATQAEPSGFTGGVACARFLYDQPLVALLLDVLQHDPTRGLGGLDYAVELRAAAEGQPAADDVYAIKRIRVSPRVPASRAPNHNPVIHELQVARNAGGGFPVQPRHCADPQDDDRFDVEVEPGDVVTLYPIEPDGTREQFDVPTLDGQFETFTEIMTYQWLATAGSFSDDITGGRPDIFGNETLLGTEWTAPAVAAPTKISVWVIQRDERYGVSMREICIRVAR